MPRTGFFPLFAALTVVTVPAFAATTPTKPTAAKPMATTSAKPMAAKPMATTGKSISGKMVSAKLANGKTVTYDCSKPGNKAKAACK